MYLIFDIGGLSIKYGLLDMDANIHLRGSYTSNKDDFEIFFGDMLKVVRKIQEEYFISGISLSSPGAVNCDTGIVGGSSGLPCIHGPNFKEHFKKTTGFDIEIENDANCAGLGELWKGAGAGCNSIVSIVIGNGIGGSLIIDKKVVHGKNFHGGEFGYMIADMQKSDEKISYTTWSSTGSTYALMEQYANISGGNPTDYSGTLICELAESGDKDAIKILDDFYLTLARGIFNVFLVVDPDKILIGGGISQRDGFIDKVREGYNKIISSGKGRVRFTPIIEACQFTKDANLVGALYHYLQRKNQL